MRILEKEDRYDFESAGEYCEMVEKYKNLVHKGFAERALANSSGKGRILDLGIGPGHIIAELLKRGNFDEAVGVDNSSFMLEKAKDNANRAGVGNKLKLVESDVMKVELENDCFDAVICFNTLHHFKDPLALLERMEKLAKKDGAVFLGDLVRPRDRLIPFYVSVFAGRENGKNGNIRDQYEESLRASLSRREWRELFDCFKKDERDVLRTHFITHKSIMRRARDFKKNKIAASGGNYIAKLIRNLFYS